MYFRHAAVLLSMLGAFSGCGDGSATNVPRTLPLTTPAVPFNEPRIATEAAPVTTKAPTAFVLPDTGIKQDAAKYPQDTAEKALESIAKALEANDLGYQIAWLFTPDYTQRMLEKYKTIDAAVAANQDQRIIDGRKGLLDSIRKMLEAKNITQGSVNGIRWVCYRLGESQLIQLEQQPDGRWCMNPKVREKKQ